MTTHRCVCPHDCPDTCGMVVTVDATAGPSSCAATGPPVHPRLPLPEGDALPRPRLPPGPAAVPAAARRAARARGSSSASPGTRRSHRSPTRFQEIAASADGPQAILPYSYAGTMGKLQCASLDRRFFHRLGASLLDRTICATAGAAGCDVTLGTRAVIDPEAVGQRAGTSSTGARTPASPTSTSGRSMHQARKRGAKIVTIDPYRSTTAAKCDWWMPIRPGTDAALALGMMHVIFRDGLQDEDYLRPLLPRRRRSCASGC